MNLPVFVFDIDGTLTAERFHNDQVRDVRPYPLILDLALSLQRNQIEVVVVTARPNYLYEDTLFWLNKVGIEPAYLLMRDDNDERPDVDVRRDQISHVLRDYGTVTLVFDDKPDNCLAIRNLGVPCILVEQR